MSSITQLCRLSNLTISSYKTVLQGRTSWLNPVQICNYTKKSAEQKLGIERPKRPLTPFFKFMTQMRPALLAKNPGITAKEAIAWSSKHWQQLDIETKSQMTKEYEKDLEDYKKIKAMYESSLTDEQKADIQRVREEMAAAKEKRKLKAEFKELGKPKKPMSSYFLYMQSRKDSFKGKQMKEYQIKVKADWQRLPESEKAKYEKQAMELMNKYSTTAEELLKHETTAETEISKNDKTAFSIYQPVSDEVRSTGDNQTQSNQIKPDSKNKEQSKTIMGSIKNFFKF